MSDPRPPLELRYCRSAAELDQLEPIWNALQDHHVEITPELGKLTPKRSHEDAWRVRRSKYRRWLEDPRTFFVLAIADERPVGYAFVTVGMPYASWASGERLAELETLSVLPGSRGAGVGAALIGAVWKRLAELGVEDMQITTTTTNVDAQRFYEREGFARRFLVYYGKSPLRAEVDTAIGSGGGGQACDATVWRRLHDDLSLRLLSPGDAEELHAVIGSNRDHLARWMPWAEGQAFDDTAQFLERTRKQLEDNDGFQLAIVREGQIVGVISYLGVDWASRSTGIGYWLAASEQGRGTMTAAARALLEHAFSAWRLNRVEIRVATENERSIEIPKRLGFREEGTLRQAEWIGERHVDIVVYSLLATEWLSRSPAPGR